MVGNESRGGETVGGGGVESVVAAAAAFGVALVTAKVEAVGWSRLTEAGKECIVGLLGVAFGGRWREGVDVV